MKLITYRDAATRPLALLTAMTVATAVLAGCSGGFGESGDTSSDGKTTISLSMQNENVELSDPATWNLIQAFETANPDIKIDVSGEPQAQHLHAHAGKVHRHVVGDSREGWAEAVEILERLAFRKRRDDVVILDFSKVRPKGAPIMGMQGRPASDHLLDAHHALGGSPLDIDDLVPLALGEVDGFLHLVP